MGKSGKGKSLKAKDVSSGDAIAAADSKGKPSATCDIGKKSSSGCCVKLIFFTLLAVFCVVATVIYIDYKPGQLKEAYGNIPPEIRDGIEHGAKLASGTLSTISVHAKQHFTELKSMIRNMVKGVVIGGVDIEHLLFADKFEAKRMEEKKLAEEEQKRKVELQKKLEEEKERKRRDAEAEKLKLEKEKRMKEENDKKIK